LCERVRLDGWTVASAAEAAGVSERTTYRWLARWDRGEAMTDRSSAPRTVANRTDDTIVALIRTTAAGSVDGAQDRGGAADADVDGLRSAQAPRAEPAVAPRAARALQPGRAASAPPRRLRRQHPRRLTVERVMTDTAPATGPRSTAPASPGSASATSGPSPIGPALTAKPSGSSRRCSASGAYAISYESNLQQRQALLPWLRYYNCRRPHSALGHKTPISQLG
jgi:transposase InsO family protein